MKKIITILLCLQMLVLGGCNRDIFVNQNNVHVEFMRRLDQILVMQSNLNANYNFYVEDLDASVFQFSVSDFSRAVKALDKYVEETHFTENMSPYIDEYMLVYKPFILQYEAVVRNAFMDVIENDYNAERLAVHQRTFAQYNKEFLDLHDHLLSESLAFFDTFLITEKIEASLYSALQ